MLKLRKRTLGQALTEFALILPALLLVTMGTFDFGRALFTYSMVSNGLRNGLRNAQVLGYSTYSGSGVMYADCADMRAKIRSAFFMSNPTITIRYVKASDGSELVCTDGMDSIDPNWLDNGDMLQINVTSTVNFITRCW